MVLEKHVHHVTELLIRALTADAIFFILFCINLITYIAKDIPFPNTSCFFQIGTSFL